MARDRATATAAATAARATVAEEKAFAVVPSILRARKAGCATLAQVADWLTEHGIEAPGGRGWRPATVLRIERRTGMVAVA